MSTHQNRRDFLAGTFATAAASALFRPRSALADTPPLETTIVSFATAPGICIAPQYIAEQLLRADGFTEVRYPYVEPGIPSTEAMARGDVDFGLDLATSFLIPLDKGTKVKILTGLHVGCYEVIARKGINSILDLKGKRVGVGGPASDPFMFMSVIADHVGLDSRKDIVWVMDDTPALDLFRDGKIDAFLSFPPEAQELRNQRIGNVIINSLVDKPWSNYFCCMLAGNPKYVEEYPVAAKRVVRAILKSADICASNPELAARLLTENRYADDYALSLQALREIRYASWRENDPEDTLRFFALRLHEAGIIKSGPHEIIAIGSDWSFLNEIKRELKA